MRYNPRGSLRFLVLLSGFVAMMAAAMGYILMAATTSKWIGHYFDLPYFVSDLIGMGIFFLVPVAIIAGFVED